MPTDYTDLGLLLRDLVKWHVVRDGIKCRLTDRTPAHGTPVSARPLVPWSFWSGLHPDLPVMLDAACAYRTRVLGNHTPSGHILKANLHHLRSPCVITTAAAKQHWLFLIRDVHWNGTADVLTAALGVYQLKTSVPPTTALPAIETIPYVGDVEWVWEELPVSWFDTRYPGWRDRHALLHALDSGLPKQERIDYILQGGQLLGAAADLPTLQFD